MKFITASQILSLIPGKLGALARSLFYRKSLTRVGKNVYFPFGVTFSSRCVEIGDNVRFGVNSDISSCIIGNNVLFSQGVVVMSGKNQHSFNRKKLFQKSEGLFRKPEIQDNVWIGTYAIIAADVAKDSIIGAGSFVNKDCDQPGSLYAGIPAKFIKTLDDAC